MAQLHESFASLHTAIQDEDYDEALNVSNRILASHPEDSDAHKCKILSLIHLNRFSDVIEELSRDTGQHTYELAYALYRERKLEEALHLLEKGEEDQWLELKAQVLAILLVPMKFRFTTLWSDIMKLKKFMKPLWRYKALRTTSLQT
jgi:tetratricopeptide (TPR) repeat protein